MAEETQNVSIACNATGRPLPRITWSKLGWGQAGDGLKARDGTLKIYNVTRKEGGIYICKAESILGSATDTAQLMVFSPLRFTVRPPQEVTPFIGSTLRLSCSAESDLSPTIYWRKEGRSSLSLDSNVLLNGTLILQTIKKTHEGSYICKASNALTTIEAKVKVNSAIVTSCSVIKKYVSSVSGNYVIDPDGEGGLAPFSVFCDMTDKSGVGVTVISHDSESRTHVKGYGSPGSYSRDIHYTGASLSQLASLTGVSLQCEQFIKYECHGSMFWFPNIEPDSWWVSRDSEKMTYWGGASPGSGKCACGMTNSCAVSGAVCNCDKNDYVWREDSGPLTDKSKLPVKQLRFGDTGGGREEGYYTLGKLKCFGIA